MPAQKFYLLIDFLGPKLLNAALREFSADPAIPVTMTWDGSERRRAVVLGDHPRRRPIDDAKLCGLILRGQAFPAYNAAPAASGNKRMKKS